MLIDNLARKWIESLEKRIDIINGRTKSHTIQIRKLIKLIKELEAKK